MTNQTKFVIGSVGDSQLAEIKLALQSIHNGCALAVVERRSRDGSHRLEATLPTVDPTGGSHQLVECLRRLDPPTIRLVRDQARSALRIVCEYDRSFVVDFQASTLHHLARLGATLDPDLYWVPTEASLLRQADGNDYAGQPAVHIELRQLGQDEHLGECPIHDVGSRLNIVENIEHTAWIIEGMPDDARRVALQAASLVRLLHQNRHQLMRDQWQALVVCSVVGGNGSPLVLFSRSLVSRLGSLRAALRITVSPRSHR